MISRQETNTERALGRMEGKMEGVVEALNRLEKMHEQRDAASAQRDKMLAELTERLTKMEDHAHKMIDVVDTVTALNKSVTSFKLQSRAFVLGFGVASGAAGAASIAGINKLYLAFFGG